VWDPLTNAVADGDADKRADARPDPAADTGAHGVPHADTDAVADSVPNPRAHPGADRFPDAGPHDASDAGADAKMPWRTLPVVHGQVLDVPVLPRWKIRQNRHREMLPLRRWQVSGSHASKF
jgi:hypothetical protein